MIPLLKKIFLVDLFQGLWVTFRNQHPKNIYTEQYPIQRPKVAERYRGAPRLNINPDNGETLCISCDLCAKACPENLIVVTSVRNEQTKRKDLTTFTYDIMNRKTSQTDPYLPVIVLTAQPGHKLRALQAGARDFISKPFDLVEVTTRIRNMLEVRLLYRKLDDYSRQLELAVEERTAELRESESRFRSLTELASDWYWEQDETGAFTRVSGPVQEMLGIQVDSLADGPHVDSVTGWVESQRATLQTMIAQRQPFLDFLFSRVNRDGSQQHFRVSGEPMFNQACQFLGYRGIGIEVMGRL